jgi:ATP-dependent Clp protease ATP-binding subunit ClpB
MAGRTPWILFRWRFNADGSIEESAKLQVQALLRRSFRPEFLNRLDEIVFYKPLTKADVTKIIDLQIAKLNSRLENQQIRCVLTEEAKNAIVDAAYDPQYGARPLRRYVQHTVETMLSRKLLRGEVLPGQVVTVDVEDGELVM